MIKRIALFMVCIGLFLIGTAPVSASDVTLRFFWSYGCPHCAKEKVFLNTLKERYPQVEIKDYEITYSRENSKLLDSVGKELHADVSGVPFTVIGSSYFVGFHTDETTGKDIEEEIRKTIGEINGTVPGIGGNPPDEHTTARAGESPEGIPETLSVPLFGHIPVKNFSLPLLTFTIALLDGFNPCAMWTLLFLISLLLGMKDRKRMWILGITFIVTSGLVYFLFLSAWLNVFLFLGLVLWVRIVIGLVAVGAGGYNIREYVVNKKGGCQVMGDEKRQKTFEKIRSITQKRQFIVALGGIILLAVAVNMVELICSAGLPAIYTKILSLSNLPTWHYDLYLILYTFIFMLDDLFIFFTAMITLQAVGIQSKYARFSHLIGGVLMGIIGVLLLFKPEWLMFG